MTTINLPNLHFLHVVNTLGGATGLRTNPPQASSHSMTENHRRHSLMVLHRPPTLKLLL